MTYKWIIVKTDFGYEKDLSYDHLYGFYTEEEVDAAIEIIKAVPVVRSDYQIVKEKDLAHVDEDRKKKNDSIKWNLGLGRKK